MILSFSSNLEEYSGTCQTFMIELLAKIVDGFFEIKYFHEYLIHLRLIGHKYTHITQTLFTRRIPLLFRQKEFNGIFLQPNRLID